MIASATEAETGRLAGRCLAAVLCFGILSGASYDQSGAGEACRDQAAIAEHAASIPDGLLLAIGKRESGRLDARTSGILPWPWSVNRDGEGYVFETEAEAEAFVAAAQRAGSQSIDVGCFQVNLKYHPGAFASLKEAFDPGANAAYAARLLRELHDRRGNWEAAVADYHSTTPWYGEPYRNAVLAIWHGLDVPATPVSLAGLNPVRIEMGIHIYAPEMQPTTKRPAVPVREAAVPTSSRAEIIPMIAPHPVGGLPAVITPYTAVARR